MFYKIMLLTNCLTSIIICLLLPTSHFLNLFIKVLGMNSSSISNPYLLLLIKEGMFCYLIGEIAGIRASTGAAEYIVVKY